MATVPDQTYYPSAKARLIVRFDEFGSTVVQSSSPRKPVPVLRGLKANRAPLEVSVDPSAPPGVSRFFLQASAAAPAGGPQDQTGSGDQLTWSLPGIIPKRASWSQNGIRVADTLTMTFKFQDCPIDPRTVRSCAVELYLGTVSGDDYARGVAGETRVGRSGVLNVTEPLNVIPDTWTDESGQPRTNLRFQGFVDKWTVDWTDDEEPLVTLECRDNTQLLIDVEVPAGLVIAAAKPIDRAVADYLANFASFSGLTVEYRPAGATPPTLGGALAGTSFQPQLGPAPARGGGATSKLSVWDYLTDVCGALGHNVRVEGTTIVVEQVQTLLSNKTSRRAADPFRGRSIDGETFQYRRFIWGRNLKSQKISRNFSKHAPTNIEVRCLVPETVVEASAIEKAYRRAYAGPVARVVTEGGRVLSGTPNHPVLTARGWVPLGDLVEGDDLVCCSLSESRRRGDPHVDAAPTEFGELFDTLADSFDVERMPTRDVDFHGDGRDGDVEVVCTDRPLKDRREPAATEHVGEICLEKTCLARGPLFHLCESFRRAADLLRRAFDSSRRLLGLRDRGQHRGTDLGVPPSSLAGRGESSHRDPSFGETSLEDTRGNPALADEGEHRDPVDVTTAKVIKAERVDFDGHVYNLQTDSEWYVASGIVVHNCYSTRRKKDLVVRFPDPVTSRQLLAAHALPGDGGTDQKWLVWKVRGIEDVGTLNVIAQNVYQSVGRNEFSLELETKNLASFGGGNLDPDVLDLLVGDTFELLVARDDEGDSITTTESDLMARGRELMERLGFDPGFAAKYAQTYTAAGFQTLFRLRQMMIEWDHEEGVTLNVHGVNYVEVRVDQPFGGS